MKGSPSAATPNATTAASAPEYVLGHSDAELQRLEQQAMSFRDLTEDVFRRAGLGPGMRVLDVGSGVGDVSLLAAEFVGPSGSVLGIERAPEAVASARRRVDALGKHWVRFVETDIGTFQPEESFDAVVGRLILMYLPDPASFLRRVSAFVRPGGILAFQEMCMPMARSVPGSVLYRQVLDWMMATFSQVGFEADMGAKLLQAFNTAGLPPLGMAAGSNVGGGPDAPAYAAITGVMRSLLPATERLGVATAMEVAIETMQGRLRDEAIALNATIFSPTLVGAWARVPA